jgi:hypothetical protein
MNNIFTSLQINLHVHAALTEPKARRLRERLRVTFLEKEEVEGPHGSTADVPEVAIIDA